MKKTAYLILGFIIGGVLTYYFCPRSVEVGITEVKVVKPKGVISVSEATALSENWSKFRKQAVDSASARHGRKNDNRSVSWSLEDIENYLAYAKQESKALGYDMTGITVYLGVYGKNAGQSKKDLTTMFIAPTGKKTRSEANSLNLSLLGGGRLPVDPLNDGDGGNNGYP